MLQNVGYVNFIILTFIGSGYLILRFDGRKQAKDKLQKEHKIAHVLGWVNIGLGSLTLVINIVTAIVT
ncbi:CLC_0170 family protein [Paenibacillus sepulcri]|uniref:DUF350 domain-containing protein n=1 Tax=Paenibacillus sepulcri TaxID=359917 RepID=A0ABS7CC21_9BACL|nr:hypothetical protein [Paenibacillus sepulcri]